MTLELCDRQQLIQDLTADFRLIDQGRRSCMIFELYQRLRANLSNDLEKRGILQDGKKLEALLDEVRRGKAFPEDGIIYWMMKFETTPEAQVTAKGKGMDGTIVLFLFLSCVCLFVCLFLGFEKIQKRPRPPNHRRHHNPPPVAHRPPPRLIPSKPATEFRLDIDTKQGDQPPKQPRIETAAE